MADDLNLKQIQFDFGILKPLYRELRSRNALPSWWPTVSRRLEGDWVSSFHKALTQTGWPSPAQNAQSGSVDVSFSPEAILADTTNVIVFPSAVIPLLWELLQAVWGILERPPTNDPDVPILIPLPSLNRAIRRVGVLIGRLRETECPDCTCPDDPWLPAVIAASHFIYCHEVNHVALHRYLKQADTVWSSPTEEFECDRLAFILMALTS
jgi:hypothetical protein